MNRSYAPRSVVPGARRSQAGRAEPSPIRSSLQPPAGITPPQSTILALQRTVGNAAVNQLLQRTAPTPSGRSLIPALNGVIGPQSTTMPLSQPVQSAVTVQRERGLLANVNSPASGLTFPFTVSSLVAYFTTHLQAQLLDIENEPNPILRACEVYLRDTEIPDLQGKYTTALANLQQAITTEGLGNPDRPITRADLIAGASQVARRYATLLTVLRDSVNRLNESYTETYKPTKDGSQKTEDPTSAKAKATAELKAKMVLEYDKTHGTLHFQKKPTDKKSVWNMKEPAANILCEAEIREHLDTLLAGTADKDWTAWYITKSTKKSIGKAKSGGEKGGIDVSMFTIQLQVSKEFGLISYHGYPDEKTHTEGVGYSKYDMS
jgi:hypothetical protein